MQPGELRFGSRVWTPEHDFGEALHLTCGVAEKRELERLEELARAGRLLRRVLPAGDSFYMVCKSTAQVRGVLSEEERLVNVVVSDATVDHYRDSTDPNGWKFDWYTQNPVVLYDHWYSVHGIVGHSERWWIESGQLISRDRFDAPEENEAAGMVFRKIVSGSLRTVSVGFKPIAWKKILNAEGEWTGGFLFSEQQKLEHSWVAIPANPNAHLGLDAATPEKGLPESTLRIAQTLTTKLQAGSLVERLRGD